MQLFPKNMKKTSTSKLKSVTLRGFGGGWNAVDDDASMSSKYLKTLTNFHRTSSGGQKLRWGNVFFADITKVSSKELREDSGLELREDSGIELREDISPMPTNSIILDMVYFSSALVVVATNGYIVKVSDTGSMDVIWSPAIAAALPGAPSFWSSGLTLVQFVPYKNTMAIHNGVDKPISIDGSFNVTYLQDLATGSNVNVPIGKYACIASNYHCVAGFANAPTQIVISSSGTAGTFPLDPAPNDAITIDVGAYAPEGAAAIRGVAGFRSYLIVFLQDISLQVQLGIYDSNGNHTPKFPDAFPKFGLIGSRCISKIDSDLAFAGIQGISTAKRNAYIGGQIDNTVVSSLVEPAYKATFGKLTDTQKQLQTFTVFDPFSHDLIVFEPGGTAFCYTSNEKLQYKSWSLFKNVQWSSGCTSLLGRVFLSSGSRIYQLGNDVFGEKYYADKVNDRDSIWAPNTQYLIGNMAYDKLTNQSYTCAVAHISRNSGTFEQDRTANPSFWMQYNGIPIDFELEMPWFSGEDPMKVKKNHFLTVGSKGTAEFTVEMYVDNLYKDYDGNVIYSPAISMTFIGNDAPGFGAETLEGPFGTGRRSRDPRLYNYPAKFKSAKFRIYGSTNKPLEINSFSFLYARGSYFR